MLKGTVRMHTPSGPKDYEAGQAFYWAPGHAPEALEDVEYVDFSPTQELHAVLNHVQQQAGGSLVPDPAAAQYGEGRGRLGDPGPARFL